MRTKIFGNSLSALILSASFIAIPTTAHAVIDSNASIVYLRKSCTEGGVAVNNCFTTTSDLQNWIPTRSPQPGPSSPLLVEIGPGQFDGFLCSNLSNVSLRGSGRDKTVLGSTTISSQIGLTADNCSDLSVQDLEMASPFIAVYWEGTGSSTWTNVDVEGGDYGWSETGCTSQQSVHRWFSSTIHASYKTAYAVQCSQNWFYGSEIIAAGPGGIENGLRAITAHSTTYPSEVHVYGSVIRVIPDPGTTFPTPGSLGGDGTGLVAVVAGQNSQIHIHGTGIDVMGNNVSNDIAALIATNGGLIHATQTAFMLNTPAPGQVYRIKNEGGTIMAPYLWENEVLGMPLVSEDGADMTVENQCVGTTCSTTQPHLLVYSSSCTTNGPWFDIGAGKCRGQ